MSEPIRGLVADIVSETDVALNIGAKAGVEIGMKFAVLRPSGQAIVDPASGDVLETLLVARTVVKVVHVQELVSVARTFRVHKANSIFAAFGSSSERKETLRSDQKAITRELAEEDSIVKVGDPVVEYTEEEFPGIVADF
jgi:hypothetical protein